MTTPIATARSETRDDIPPAIDTASMTTSPSTRVKVLDGSRGLAALFVIAFHCCLCLDELRLQRLFTSSITELKTASDFVAKVVLTTFSGDSAVVFFFLLSGCVLSRSLERDFSRNRFAHVALAFSIRRVLRIYPAHLVVMACMLGAYWLFGLIVPSGKLVFSYENIVRNGLLIAPDVNAPTWTLIIELIVTPALLCAGWLTVRTGTFGSFAFLLISLLIYLNYWIFANYWHFTHYLIYFAFGSLVPTILGQNAAAAGRLIGGIALLLAFVYIRLLSYSLSVAILQGSFGFVLLSWLYHNPSTSAVGLLGHPVAELLGRLSYSVYLWHWMLVILFRSLYMSLSLPLSYPLLTGLLAAAPVTLVALGFAHLSERLVERPSIRCGKAISSRILSR